MTNTVMVAWGGLLIGLVFGAVGQRTGFCLLSGLRQQWTASDGRMLRTFLLALAVAILGTQALAARGLIGLGEALYLQHSFSWPLYLFGGALFGYGMVMTNGCPARALVLLGSGNLRSLLVLLLVGLAGHMTLTGLLAPLRLWLGGFGNVQLPFADPSITGLLGHLGLGLPGWLLGALAAAALAGYAFAAADFRRSPRYWLGGLLIGLLIPAGWLVTGHLGADDFEPVRLASLTFIAPVGDSMQYIMLSTGTSLSFGVSVVAGVVLGSLAAALVTRGVNLQGFPTPQRMLRYTGGAVLMGIGGALALGCSVGQGLTGLSTLALASLLAATGIVLGARLGLRGPLRLSTL